MIGDSKKENADIKKSMIKEVKTDDANFEDNLKEGEELEKRGLKTQQEQTDDEASGEKKSTLEDETSGEKKSTLEDVAEEMVASGDVEDEGNAKRNITVSPL